MSWLGLQREQGEGSMENFKLESDKFRFFCVRKMFLAVT